GVRRHNRQRPSISPGACSRPSLSYGQSCFSLAVLLGSPPGRSLKHRLPSSLVASSSLLSPGGAAPLRLAVLLGSPPGRCLKPLRLAVPPARPQSRADASSRAAVRDTASTSTATVISWQPFSR